MGALEALESWLGLASAVVGIAVSIGAASLVKVTFSYFWDRYRWNTFDEDIQKWLEGRGSTPPAELAQDEWESHVALMLKDAQFDPGESEKLLQFAVIYAKGRKGQQTHI